MANDLTKIISSATTRLANWTGVTSCRRALLRIPGLNKPKHVGLRCSQAPRPGIFRPTKGPLPSTGQAIRTRPSMGAEVRHATHRLRGAAPVDRPKSVTYTFSSPGSVAASVHWPADTSGPPSAGFQTCSPVSSSTIHSPSAHSTSAYAAS